MNMEDMKMTILSGDPVEIPNICRVYPLTLNGIRLLGSERYNHYLNLLCMESSDIKSKLDINEDINSLDFLIINAHHDQFFKDTILESFKVFTRESVGYDDHGFFYILDHENNKKAIEHDGFEKLKKVIRMQNCLDGIESFQDNPANEKARLLLEKKRKLKQKVNRAKSGESGDSEPLTLFDLISVLAGCSNNYNLINREDNPMNVWNLTMFQFNDAFNRLKMFNDYSVNIQALLHGSQAKDVEMKHYISKITRD